MNYQQIQPPNYLREYIRYFWVLESNCIQADPKTFRTIADGCPGIVFQQSEKSAFFDQHKNQLPGIFLYGQTTQSREISTVGTFRTIGIYFYPHALKSVFKLDADELTNSCLDLNELAGKQGFSLSEQLLTLSDAVDQISVLSAYLEALVRKNSSSGDLLTPYALSQIVESNGRISLKKVQEELQISERSFERRFKQTVGIPPKLFARICRFQASLQQLRNHQYQKLSDIAFENDYADQSHFIRSFKEFAGFSPYHYQKQINEVVANFPELKK